MYTACDDGTNTLVYATIYGSIGLIFFICTIFTVGKLCKDQRERRYVRLVYYMTTIFCVDTSILLLELSIIFPFFLCKTSLIFKYMLTIEYTLVTTYFIHSYLLWILLLAKLYYLFEGTSYKMRSRTIILWIITFTISGILIFGTVFLVLDPNSEYYDPSKHPMVRNISTIIWTLMVIVPIGLSVSFILKLRQIYKSIPADIKRSASASDLSINMNEIDPLLAIITKHTLLTLFCIPITSVLLVFSWIVTVYPVQLVPFYWLKICFAFDLVDVFTNFFCIILSYEVFDGLYQKLCGRLDKKCREFCMMSIHNTASLKKNISQYQRLYDI